MSKTTVYNQQGEKVKEITLDPKIFGFEVKPELIQHAIVVQQANARHNLAHTKDRSDVAGGGRKPWRQKGTGRARHGSIRSPLWRGGGVTFGPRKNQNYALKINKKARRKAILMGLSDKATHDNIILVDKLNLEESKTKKFFEILQNLELREKKIGQKKGQSAIKKSAPKKFDKAQAKDQTKLKAKAKTKNKSILVILPKKDQKLQRASKNIPRVNTILADSLNVFDLIKNQKLLIPVDSIEKISKTFVK